MNNSKERRRVLYISPEAWQELIKLTMSDHTDRSKQIEWLIWQEKARREK